MTDDLIARLRAGLDEDERVAQAATVGPWRADGGRRYSTVEGPEPDGHQVAEVGGCDDHPQRGGPDAAHIARHDPERARRWVKAAREVLELHCAAEDRWPQYANGDRSCLGCGAGNDGEMLVADVNDCPVLRALASVYGDGGP